MPQVERRQNIIVGQPTLANNNTWNTQIILNFIPDEVAIKKINYYEDGTAGLALVLRSNLADDFVATFNEYGNGSSEGAVYTLKKPISGMFQFQILDAGMLPIAGAGVPGQVAIHLEFVKYKEKTQPDKKFLAP